MKLKIIVDKSCLEASKNCISNQTKPEVSLVGQNCAIARAICSIFPNSWVAASEILFFKGEIPFNDGMVDEFKSFSETELPYFAQVFIQKFDKSHPDERIKMEEIEFEIDVPEEVINNIGDMEEVKRLISTSPTLELV